MGSSCLSKEKHQKLKSNQTPLFTKPIIQDDRIKTTRDLLYANQLRLTKYEFEMMQSLEMEAIAGEEMNIRAFQRGVTRLLGEKKE